MMRTSDGTPRDEQPAPSDDRPSDAQISRIILLLAWAGFMSLAFQRVCDAMLPQLARTFAVSSGQAAYAIAAFAIAYGALQLFFGPLGDRFGKLHVIAWATIASIAGTIGTALADSFSALIFFRTLTGITAAGIVPLAMAWIGDTIAYEQRQATLARFLIGTTLGQVGGQVLGGAFADTIGWRWAFVVLGILCLTLGVLLYRNARRYEHGTKPAAPHRAHPADAGGSRYLNVLHLPWARVILLVALVEGVALFGAWAFVPTYLHDRFGLSLTLAGIVAGVFGLGGLVYTLIARRLVLALKERGLVIGGGILMSIAFITLAVSPTWWWAVPASFIAGLGLYMMHATLQTHATQMAPHARGTAVSLFACAVLIGQSGGVAGASAVIDAAGAAWVFWFSALVLPVLAWWFAQALARRHRTD